MAEDKAQALKEAAYNIKIYYNGDTPAKCGSVKLLIGEIGEPSRIPWLVKAYRKDGRLLRQFVESRAMYNSLSKEMGTVLDVAIVNNKQREALGIMLDKILYSILMQDQANEGDYIV